MRILLLAPNPPSPVRVRPYQLALALSARGHLVDLAFPVAGVGDRRDLRRLEAMGFRTIHRTLRPARRLVSMAAARMAGRPLQAGFSWNPALMAEVERALERAARSGQAYNVIHVEHLRGSAYARRLAGRWPLVWDAVDSISDLFAQAALQARHLGARWAARLEFDQTRIEEARLLHLLPWVAVTAHTDRAALSALWWRHYRASRPEGATPRRPQIHVISNGVDLQRFAPCEDTLREPASLLFSGKLGYHANEAAARHLIEDVMPRIWRERPDTRLILAGAQAPTSLRRLVATDARIEQTGYVADMREPMCRASVAIAPLVYGVGIQNKVLEAMACATPVVATPAAARAVVARDGQEILVGQGAGELAERALTLLGDSGLAARLGRAGRELVERDHDWLDAAARFERLYALAIGS